MRFVKLGALFALSLILLASVVYSVTLTGVGEHGPAIAGGMTNTAGYVIHLNTTTNGIITRVVLGSGDSSDVTTTLKVIQNGVVLTSENQGLWKYNTNPMVKIAPANYSQAIHADIDNGNFQIMINKTGGAGLFGKSNTNRAFAGTLFGYYSQGISAFDSGDGQWSGYPWVVFNQTEVNVSVGDTITLINPLNNTISTTSRVDLRFFTNITNYDYNWTNFTQYIWYDGNNSLLNLTQRSLSGVNDASNVSITLPIGNYIQNFYACYDNSTNFPTCQWYKDAATGGNSTFAVGASVSSHTYNANTYETEKEDFMLVVDLPSGAEVSLAQLQYNGTNYTISNTSLVGNTLTLYKQINIPLNVNPLANQTNSFLYRFTYAGSQVQTLSGYTQESSFISLHECNATALYLIQALNMTMLDETDESLITASATTKTNFQGFFQYWLGDGTPAKNYSYSNLNNVTQASYQFCLFPETASLRTNLQSIYDASGYSERQYYLDNATLTNVSSNTPLYLLNDSSAVKFTMTTKQGATFLADAYVTISKFFVGDGSYKTISIRKTDDNGQFVEYLDLDRDYRFSIILDGDLLAVIDKKATCSTAPCEITLQVDEGQGSIWSSLSDTWAGDVLSNITYDPTTSMITYTFIDTTGLANYFRLEVRRSNLNETIGTVCDTKVYASSGSATCNMTGLSGDYTARGFISRSPEKLDQIFHLALGELAQSLGLLAVLAAFLVILTVVFGGAAISGGNPSVILFIFGIAVLGTKLMTLLPFSWGVIAVIELLIIVLISYTKS